MRGRLRRLRALRGHTAGGFADVELDRRDFHRRTRDRADADLLDPVRHRRSKCVKVASGPSGGLGANTWTTTGFSATSLALSTATTLRILPSGEVYRANVSWTLSTGP